MFLFIIAEPDEAAKEITRRYRSMMLHLASTMLGGLSSGRRCDPGMYDEASR